MIKRFVVYTVITGGFDDVKQPAVIDERFDYVLFTDNVSKDKIGVWNIRPIEYNNADARIKSRYPKVYPTKVLAEYEASLYIDGNIQILLQKVYDRCVELSEEGVEWAGIKHQGRKGLYQELNAIIGLGWVHDYDVLDWYQFLRKEKFADDLGMFENNIIFRKHCKHVEEVSGYWGDVCVDRQLVKRDQFSLMWAISKAPNLNRAYLLPENENAWNNSGYFVCESHQPHKRVLDKSLWEKMRDRYVRMFYSSGDWEIYYTKWFDKLIKWSCPHVAMHIWTFGMMIRYDLGFLFRRAVRRFRKNVDV